MLLHTPRRTLLPRSFLVARKMERTKMSVPHEERTKAEPRDVRLHRVTIHKIEQANREIKLFQLRPVDNKGDAGMKFLPGQWLDVHIPTLPKAGGFTITSPPSLLSSPTPHIELAIQTSPSNPAAAFMWKSPSSILGTELQVRVGGSFTWPPAHLPDGEGIERIVFVAGGVGINPLMSMLSAIAEGPKCNKWKGEVKFLYSVRDPVEGLDSVLFLARLQECIAELGEKAELKLFLTSSEDSESSEDRHEMVGVERRRISTNDLIFALGDAVMRGRTLLYVCGVPGMVDNFVGVATGLEGMRKENVMFEKWW
ncbi:NADH-cytochrome b-5 reductase [Halenospora varia]|nr:NADH-cytochrome b-5 reductase [Halenospora varia]